MRVAGFNLNCEQHPVSSLIRKKVDHLPRYLTTTCNVYVLLIRHKAIVVQMSKHGRLNRVKGGPRGGGDSDHEGTSTCNLISNPPSFRAGSHIQAVCTHPSPSPSLSG